MVGEGCDCPGRDVGREAHLERDVVLREIGQQGRVLSRRHAVPDPLGTEQR
jgi:hypothetical protein